MVSTAGGDRANPSSSNTFIATLKGKINGLEETCSALTEELNFYKNEIANLRGEKQDLEANLAKKTDEMRKQLVDDVQK
jgi:chromosome segregation ATPase